MMRIGPALVLAIGSAGVAIGLAPFPAAARRLDPAKPPLTRLTFSRDIMPILSDRCFKCHGPDPETRMAGLRLDAPESVFANRNGHFAIVRGHPERSRLVARIRSHEMPPPGSGKSLSAGEIAILTRWVAEGAPYGRLWSFEPLPTRPPVPAVANGWAKDNLDRFVWDRLHQAGLSPSPPAAPLRWLRRVTYDLSGLPPTEADIAAFLADRASGARARVVDRLLASPRFGERMAVDWLDAARYSDSYGYQSDLLSPTWPYRDWVIRAFNQNLPYDRFIVDQIAGDLLPNATVDERLATAFNRLHRQSNEGGSIPLEFKTEYAADRVATFGTAMLGLTLGCARCHDHKFDPITQREYYQLFAYFNSIPESGLVIGQNVVPTPSMLLPTPPQAARLAELRTAATAPVPSAAYPSPTTPLARFTFDNFAGDRWPNRRPGKAYAAKSGEVSVAPGTGTERPAVRLDGDNGIVFHGLPGLERGDAFTWRFSIRAPRDLKGPVVLLHRTGGTDVGFCGFDLMLEDGQLTARVMRHWPGNGLGVRTTGKIPLGRWTRIEWSWDGLGRAAGLHLSIDGHDATTTVLNDRIWKKVRVEGDLGGSGGDWAFGQRFRDAGFRGGELADVEFDEGAARYVDSSAAERVRRAQNALAEFEEGLQEVPVMEECATPTPAYLLARGNYDAPRTPATRVSRDVPKCLPPLVRPGSTPTRNDRLALAEWTVRGDNPLTARVAVNRIWQMTFGTGLVETSENLGVQGSQATNQALLDYLARQFIDSGWNTKALIRRIVLSATYGQDSARSKTSGVRDPDNHLLSRGPSHRLSAEMIRDTALAAAGLLNLSMGGPPVNPYQPAGIWQENNVMSPAFVQSKGADLYRRSIYSTWKRTTPVPSMLLFDAPSREACAVRRQVTNTPLQALVLMNDIQFVEAARVLAERVVRAPGDDRSRLREVFRRLAARDPDARELAILAGALADQRAQFLHDPHGARALVTIGDHPPAAGIDPVETAAMTAVVQIVMNSDPVVWER